MQINEDKAVEIKEEMENVLEILLAKKVTDEESKNVVSHQLKKIADHKKKVKEFFKEPVESAHKTWKWLTGKRADCMAPIEQAEKHLKSEISRYAMEQARLLEEKKKDLPENVQEMVPSKPKQMQGISVQDKWRFKVTDETKIPREYLIVDEKKINGMVRTFKDKLDIPGIEVYNEGKVSVRA